MDIELLLPTWQTLCLDYLLINMQISSSWFYHQDKTWIFTPYFLLS